MTDKQLKIVVNRPLARLFEFTLNPDNTPKWIDGIIKEVTNEWPVKTGTFYRNQSSSGAWNEYELVELEENVTFTLARKGSSYHVRYSFKPLAKSQTEFEYYEWVESGELDDTVSQEVLQKLKDVVENEG